MAKEGYSHTHLCHQIGLGLVTPILGTLCWILILLPLSIPFLLFFIYKWVLIALAKVVRRDLHPLTSGDAPFALGTSWVKHKLSVGLLLWVDGSLDLEEVQNHFYRCLLLPLNEGGGPKYEKLRASLVNFGGHIFRKSIPMEEIDIKRLIYVRALCPGESLEQFVDNWMDTRYDENCPAWEVVLIPSKDKDKDGTIVGFKVHHAFVDGYSLLHLLDVLTGSKAPYIVRERKESLLRALVNIASVPLNLVRVVGGPLKSPLVVKNPQSSWTYAFSSIDLEPVKTIRRKYNVHFAAVILTLITGTVRRFVVEGGARECDLPSHLYVGNTLPCEEHPAQGHLLCNHWWV